MFVSVSVGDSVQWIFDKTVTNKSIKKTPYKWIVTTINLYHKVYHNVNNDDRITNNNMYWYINKKISIEKTILIKVK